MKNAASGANGKVESIAQLRRICQDPVRKYNDISGLLYGWPLSIYITRLFLRLRLGAAYASSLMFLSGLAGSLLLLGPGGLRIAGFALLMFAFVLDCVDGELARYSRIDSYRWAAFDHLHHLTAKSLAFTCLGIGLYLDHGTPWTLLAGPLLSVFWLALMIVRDLPCAIFSKKIVMNDNRDKNPAYQRLAENLSRPDVIANRARPPRDADVFAGNFRMRPWIVRAFLTNFDIVVPFFLILAIVDVVAGPLALPDPIGTQSWVTVLLFAYAVVIPLHAIDVLHTSMWRGRFRNELYDLASRVDRFRERP